MKIINTKIKIDQYWLFTILVSLLLFIPYVFQKGMFLDGVTYAAISNNLSNNIGTYFKPVYSKVILNPFYEHPPFVFWIQSFFFKILGSSYFVERFYSLLTASITGYGVLLIWNLFFKSREHNWFVIFLWITIPIVFWSYSNNILENTLGLFTLFSVYFTIRFHKENKYKFLILASFFIFFAFLSKGFVGIFPLLTSVLYMFFVTKKSTKKILENFKLIIVFTILFLLSFFLFNDLRENVINYMYAQLIPSLQGKREITVNNRFKIVVDLLLELTVPILILLISYFTSKKKKIRYKKESLFFLLIGLSASIPLLISLKQRKFYLIPSFPFFILGFCLLIVPLLEPRLKEFYKKRKIIVVINFLLVIALSVISFSLDGYSRDKNKIQDIEKIVNVVKKGEIISTSKSLNRNWQIVAYFLRKNYISLTSKEGQAYYLKQKNEVLDSEIKDNFKEINLDLSLFNLYKKN